ncbi:hypothetical protein [Frankia gtarii]|uniref:hypothetical protein n=1 Tax=Frankia gtarii TaxID=2950102 RepID=UPI0021BE3C5E|nr:hypothetical protein [Frankia gtarii]
MAFGASIVINRALKPARNALGEAVGEAIADMSGATGRERERIVNNTRRVVNITTGLAVSAVIGDALGVTDVIEGAAS